MAGERRRSAGRGPGAAHDQRRQDILEAVFRLVDASGTDQVSIRNVAGAANVSVGRVQHYFATKDELLSAAFATINDRGSGRIRERLTGVGSGDGSASQPANVLAIVLQELIPRTPEDHRLFRVAQAFEAYALSRPKLLERLRTGYDELAGLLADLLGHAGVPASPSVDAGEPSNATGDAARELLGLAVGLAGLVVSGNVTAADAERLVGARVQGIVSAAR